MKLMIKLAVMSSAQWFEMYNNGPSPYTTVNPAVPARAATIVAKAGIKNDWNQFSIVLLGERQSWEKLGVRFGKVRSSEENWGWVVLPPSLQEEPRLRHPFLGTSTLQDIPSPLLHQDRDGRRKGQTTHHSSYNQVSSHSSSHRP